MRLIKILMWVIDLGFIVYWSLIITNALPAEAMFEGYNDPYVQAWNWSFFPLDIAASITGIVGLLVKRNSHMLTVISLTLTAVAGGMAIAFWSFLGSFDLSWWAPNLFLCIFGAVALLYLSRNLTSLNQGK